MTCATCTLASGCTTRRRTPFERIRDWLSAELQLRRDLRRIEMLDAHLLRDIGLHDTDLGRAMRSGRR